MHATTRKRATNHRTPRHRIRSATRKTTNCGQQSALERGDELMTATLIAALTAALTAAAAAVAAAAHLAAAKQRVSLRVAADPAGIKGASSLDATHC
mmetsp:Transcript_49930/g.106216  ORF Transcript_49930/g.106216 Transcript_49930/m.106216 type:complete len:97 (-) Transcript_49930:199-489(-)